MVKIKTKELTGAALDWAVDACEAMLHPKGLRKGFTDRGGSWERTGAFYPSRRWDIAGPIIEREITKLFKNVGGTYSAQIRHEEDHPLVSHKVLAGWTNAAGPTMLIAAMRCYVASKLGDEIDVPEELL